MITMYRNKQMPTECLSNDAFQNEHMFILLMIKSFVDFEIANKKRIEGIKKQKTKKTKIPFNF